MRVIFACGSAASASSGRNSAAAEAAAVVFRKVRRFMVRSALLASTRRHAAWKSDNRLCVGLGRTVAATASCRRCAASGAAAPCRRSPAIARRPVLDHARISTEDVAVQILRTGVAEILAVLESGIVHLDERVLISGIVLWPP